MDGYSSSFFSPLDNPLENPGDPFVSTNSVPPPSQANPPETCDDLDSEELSPSSTLWDQDLQQSAWLWTPGEEDHKLFMSDALQVPATALLSGDEVPMLSSVPPAITTVTRDKMLAKTLSLYEPKDNARIIAAFPSLDLLNHLLRSYFIRHNDSSYSWNHMPTFDPNQELLELVIGIVTAGAFDSDKLEVQKLGHALHDVHRKLNGVLVCVA